jgi:uncharacterized Rossmann fold enzyme
VIYILECQTCGLVKIGYSATPDRRMKTAAREHRAKGDRRGHIMAHHGFMPGDRPEERALHEAFAEFRVEGEWFGLPAKARNACVQVVKEYERKRLAAAMELVRRAGEPR